VPEGVKGRWVAVDLYEQVLVAYDEETPVFATLISSGLPDWPTNEGTFQTYWRLVNGYMTGAEGQSDYYLVDGVPYTMYFDDSISLHGSYWHDSYGYRHSHGCVNMTITDSQWLYTWTMDGGYEFPYVHVFATGDYLNG
jgi:lipoprotein-anchoring transpeptidase ErfK/SrfK